MISEAKGVIVFIGVLTSGETKNKVKYQRQTVRIDVWNEKFPQTLSLQCGAKAIPSISGLAEGDKITAKFTIESKTGTNGNDYTDLRCFEIKKID